MLLNKKIFDTPWYTNTNTFHVLMHLYFKTSPKEDNQNNVIVKPGQVLTKIKKIAFELGLKEKEVTKAIRNLISSEEITKDIINKSLLLITICHYDENVKD